MDFELSDDQVALREAARDMLSVAASGERVRAVLGQPFDPDLWKEIAAQGWLGLELPERDGGLGLGFVETAVLCEEVGRAVAPAPFLSTALALAAFVRADNTEAARPWIERLSSGEAVGCVAWAERADDRGVLTLDAPAAGVVVMLARDEVRAVPLDAPPSAEPAMDATRTVGWLRLTADAGTRLGGADLSRAIFDRGAAALAAELLGASERMLEESVSYAKAREQFGRPIGSFQAVKHRLADMLVDVEGMRSAARYAAWCVATNSPERSLAASTAKSWCSEASSRVMASALQVHGGIGFTWEHDLHLYLKRAHLSERLFGAAPFHRERLARLLRARVEAGEDLW